MDSNQPPDHGADLGLGVSRRQMLKGLGIGAAAGVGFTGAANAHEVIGTPVFCGCSQLCVCVNGTADVLMAQETEDGFEIGFVVGEDELDPYPRGEPRFRGDFCLDTAQDEILDGMIIGLQVDSNRWVNPNACAQDALNAEQEQLDSTHPRPAVRAERAVKNHRVNQHAR
ncbi:twin-arginine translocation signal domain-containing protein [Halodesulfurarchaeum formicicum]|uniref:Twin-arginine translocation signal domain-containing protein n=1 Tax=Halodesulfurarchaeum formicicum TaxID=1873524 RepID=A0A1J1AFR0_9EURY|nr:twin-arginine translocation signal domain-containing protein [Halodesulfurarchaeum formicicum]APE96441.1 hypothetical protein HSR6_2010 [Halodesulfurarchaeum formicicum]